MSALLVTALERAALKGWPATVQRPAPGGWLLRATPGLARARSNHALPPDGELAPGEIEPALHRVRAFAAEYDIATGIQVSPLHRHARLMHALDERDWARHWPTLVLAGPSRPGGEAASAADHLHVVDHADLAWLAAWAKCEPERDVDAHAATVFAHLRGRAAFGRLGADAVGIAVPTGEWVGMFCLAVDPCRRRARLGTALVKALLATTASLRNPPRGAYLQVEETNSAALGLYAHLGFAEAYRYCHRVER